MNELTVCDAESEERRVGHASIGLDLINTSFGDSAFLKNNRRLGRLTVWAAGLRRGASVACGRRCMTDRRITASPTAAPRRRKRLPGGPLGLVIVLAVGLLLIFGVAQGERWLRGPWSFCGPGRPTLTGTWEGPVRARLGAEYRLFVYLEYAYRQSYHEPHNLRGTARLCTRDGVTWEYTLYGFANRSGTSVELQLSSVVSDWRSHGFTSRGAWRGETLEVVLSNNPFKPDGRMGPDRIVSSDDPDDSFQLGVLRKAQREDFETGCRELVR